MTITTNKTYKTRHGQPVKIYEILDNPNLNYQVHGAYLQHGTDDDWTAATWTIEGKYNRSSSIANPLDLVEAPEVHIEGILPVHDQVIWVWENSPEDAVPRHLAGFCAHTGVLCYKNGRSSLTAVNGATEDWPHWSLKKPEIQKYFEINGRQVPVPVRNIKEGSTYFVVDLGATRMFIETSYVCDYQIQRGLIHATEEAAKAHAEALLSFTAE